MSISSEIIAILDSLCQKFGIAVDWTQENILPYLAELSEKLISYEIATSWFWIALAIIILAVFVAVFIISIRMLKKYPCDSDVYILLAVLSAIVGLGVFVTITCVQAIDIIAAHTFPEKILIDYLSTLMRGAQL